VPSYHLSAQVVQRSKGRNVVAMAAYRAGAKLEDRGSGRVADYGRKRGVAHAEIMAPEGSADWLRDRERLWNGVEAMEKRKDAQLAREINLALPDELDAAGRLELVRGFVQSQFVAHGMVADVAIHEPVAERGDDPRNHHAHVLLTMRQATSEGLRAVKTREWNSDSLLQSWREAWAEMQNLAFERAGHRERVDHRTLAAQRDEARQRGDRVKAVELDRVAEIHIGPKARQIDGRIARKESLLPRSRTFTKSLARPGQGGFVSPRQGKPRTRELDYGRIDATRGRAEFIRELVSTQDRQSRRQRDRYEMQMARIRNKLLRAERAGARAEQESRGRIARNHRSAAFMTRPALVRQPAWQKQHRARGQGLLNEISKILAGLMRVQQRRQVRMHELVRARDIGFGRSRVALLRLNRGRVRRVAKVVC
jgi:hypothetical protein